MTKDSILVGWREWVALPELGLGKIKAKVDTGARSSSLHAEQIEVLDVDGRRRVRFTTRSGRVCEADLHDMRTVKSSTGHVQDRYFIRTRIVMGQRSWPIDLSLTSRTRMKFGMLLGREAMKNGIIVLPEGSFLQGRPNSP